MEEKIETLASLFREREEIDSQIREILYSRSVAENVKITDKQVKEVCKEIKKSIKGRKRGESCLECGSLGTRHKKGCSKSKNESSFFSESKEQPRKEIHSYICQDCKIPFKSNMEKIDAFCPECRSVNIDNYDESAGVRTYKR